MRPLTLCCLLLAMLAGCGGAAKTEVAAVAPMGADLTRQAPAPAAAGALATIADGTASQRRVGYVNVPALDALLPAGDARALARRVLGAGAPSTRALAEASVETAVRVGDVTVTAGPGGRKVAGDGPLARELGDAAPERSVIQPTSPSAVQSCLGDAAAQTIVGSTALGSDTTIGAGLRSNADAPAGLKLVLCFSPKYRRQLYGSIRAMQRRFGRPDANDPRAPVVGEDEIGEQQIARGIVPVEAVSAADLRAYLGGEQRLRSLLPAPPR